MEYLKSLIWLQGTRQIAKRPNAQKCARRHIFAPFGFAICSKICKFSYNFKSFLQKSQCTNEYLTCLLNIYWISDSAPIVYTCG